MDEAKTQLAERLKSANNVLVTVSRDPSVDQLAALLGLGLFLNKQGKHSAAVFSGKIPSTLEFLKPESTIQKNTDSLRDFIIALDKSKADKLRYKVEDNIVRIFITPYRDSIGQEDLEFSQGDFNVDVIVALGIAEQADIDDAIMAHGRILHDATLASINVASNNNALGTINWNSPSSSSLCELVTELIQAIGPDDLDEQIATALLTGIVATTDRFSNDKTSAKTMSTSSALMAAGANQQLVATQLQQGMHQDTQSETESSNQDASASSGSDGTLEINHENEATEEPAKAPEPEESMELPAPDEAQASPEEVVPEVDTSPPAGLASGPKLITEPPSLGGTLTANSTQNELDPVTDPLSMPNAEPPQLLSRKPNVVPADQNLPDTGSVDTPKEDPTFPALGNDAGMSTPSLGPPPSDWTLPSDNSSVPAGGQVHIDEDGTLSQLEEAVHSPHATNANADVARDEVNKALNSEAGLDVPQPPIAALNAQPLGPELHPTDLSGSMGSSLQSPIIQPTTDLTDPTDSNSDVPPPVPPPLGFGS